MPGKAKNRNLYILQYLWRYSDDNHPVTIADIIHYLAGKGISAERHTVSEDIRNLLAFGIDIVCVKSSPNQYFIGSRTLQLPELKLLTDAVEASRFISEKKSSELIKGLYEMCSAHQADELNRHLYVDGRVKTDNKQLYYTVDVLHTAINSGKKVHFQYFEYTLDKKKIHKHGGYVYEFSPYALLWHDDCYYVLGYSEKHQKITKFRVDRMDKAELTDKAAHSKPADFDPIAYMKSIFSMYDGEMKTIRLKCRRDMMKVIIDRFGADVSTTPCEDGTFLAEVEVSISPTFYGWLFGFAGKIRPVYPQSLVDEYIEMARKAIAESQGNSTGQ